MKIQNITKFDDLPLDQRNRLLKRIVNVAKEFRHFKTVPLQTFTAFVRKGSGKIFNRPVVKSAVFRVQEEYLKKRGLSEISRLRRLA